jgi:ABC-type cobalamin/Fe3+-siderophores transport system ATPase subunit
VCIIGPVGCGKSSILNALLAEMEKKSGSVYLASLLDGKNVNEY